MYKGNQKRLISTLSFAISFFILTGCSTLPIGQVNPNNENQNENSTENIKFSKVTPERTNELNNYLARGLTPNSTGSASYPAPTAAPTAVSSAVPMATSTPAATGTPGSDPDVSTPTPGPTDHDYITPDYYSSSSPNYSSSPSYPMPYYTSSPYSYFGSSSSFEEYSVIDFEEAHKDGFSGSYLAILKNIINPVINSLTSDARLISTYGNTDGNGKTTQQSSVPTVVPTASPTSEPYYIPTPGLYYYSGYNPYQWQFTYISSAKKEIYSILVSPGETLILRQRWGQKDLSPQSIKIDSTEAIEIVKKAVRNQETPIPYPSPTHDYIPAPYFAPGNYISSDTIYDIPEKAVINYNLEKDKNDLNWTIIFTYYDPQEPNTTYSPGYARVNAVTGGLIYFERMVKTKYYPTSTPYPDYPTATPTAFYTSSPIPPQ